MMKIQDEPIIQSLLDIDFYKFTMGQLIFKKHKDVPVRFKLTNRTSSVSLSKMIPLEQLKEQLDHVRTLRFNNSELHYLRGTNEYQERMFQEDYLQFLKNMQVPQYQLEYEGDDLILEILGSWSEATYWETICLSIINELYYRNLMLQKSRLAQDAIFATGVKNLLDKVRLLRKCPGLTFTDFGTRRRFSRSWQKYVVEIMMDELPHQLKGTSNTKLAMDLGLMPTGTAAHEMDMGYSGIYHSSDEEIYGSHKRFLHDWREMYGWGLSIDLTDTYGSDFFFKEFTHEEAVFDKGLRQDSGDPMEFGLKALEFYIKEGINPKEKMLIFSDGLWAQKMIDIYRYFHKDIMTTFGWGTDLTNDLCLKPLYLVIKLVEANGYGTVKLSDNLSKAIGRSEDVERFKKIFGYKNNFSETCKY
ncbi:MAG: nicotinate phosphoribosyltransferase [Candidatus Falkowbacteria bacterium]